MRAVAMLESWPAVWKKYYDVDLVEVYGSTSHRGHSYAYANRLEHTLDVLRKVAPPGSTILDVAAAQGNYSLAIAEAGYRVTWNDIRGILVDYVKLKYERGSIEYAPGNVFDLQLGRRYDVVLIGEIIEHVAHPDQFLSHIGQLVRPGGHVIMTTPNGQYFRYNLPKFSDCRDPSQYESVQFKPNSDGHIFLLHHDELDKLAADAGLHVERTRLITNFLTAGHCNTERALLPVLPRALVTFFERATSLLPFWMKKRLHSSFVVSFSLRGSAAGH